MSNSNLTPEKVRMADKAGLDMGNNTESILNGRRYARSGLPHRTPIEEAETPQPRPMAIIDNPHGDATLAGKVKNGLVDAAHHTKDALNHAVERTENTLSSAARKTENALNNAAKKTKESLNTAAEKTKETLNSAAEKTKETFGAAGEKTREAAHHLKDDVDYAGRKIKAEGRKVKNSIEGRDRHEYLHDLNRAKDDALSNRRDAGEVADDNAHRAAHWGEDARTQITDAWEGARTRAADFFRFRREQGSEHQLRGPVPLDAALEEVRRHNKEYERQTMREICEVHPQRRQCYSAVQHLMEMAKDDARINVELATKPTIRRA